MTIDPITRHNFETFQAIRLRSLLEDPHAFGSTYAREIAMSEEEWQGRLNRWSGDRGIGLLAMHHDEPHGIIGLLVSESDSHTAEVVSMWVAPESRRTRLGTQLLRSLEEWAGKRGVARLRLGVTKDNEAALAFYQRNGFALTAPDALTPGTFESEYTLLKQLGQAADAASPR